MNNALTQLALTDSFWTHEKARDSARWMVGSRPGFALLRTLDVGSLSFVVFGLDGDTQLRAGVQR